MRSCSASAKSTRRLARSTSIALGDASSAPPMSRSGSGGLAPAAIIGPPYGRSLTLAATRRAGRVRVQHVLGRHAAHLVITRTPFQNPADAFDDLVDRERLALDLVQPLGVHHEPVAEQHPQL